MDEWWRAHKNLLVDSGFNKEVVFECVKDMINEKYPEFRGGVRRFLINISNAKIPLIIMTAGLGDLVKEYIKQQGLSRDNIHVIGNGFVWSEDGKAIKFKKIIHVFNKNEMEIKDLPVYSDLINRKNVLLLGDSLGDVKMVEGFDYDNLIKVGFLNDNIPENLEEYKKNYDIVILEDGDFNFINKLVLEIEN